MGSTNARIAKVILVLFAVLSLGSIVIATNLSNIEDASGMFNERGYLKSNSFSYDGNEIINDFNGNLMFSKVLRYIPKTQNGGGITLKLTYNGSVGHTSYSGIDRLSSASCETSTAINLPEWIISVNNIAIQTFNFENELMSFGTVGSSEDTIAYDDDVAALINGYHDCYLESSSPTKDQYGTISILMGDGSVSQYISLNGRSSTAGTQGPYFTALGEYRSFAKDDQSRGYLSKFDSTFTLFQADGSRVVFEMYRPKGMTKTFLYSSSYPDPLDSLLIFLPVRFEFPDGPSHTVVYDYDRTTCDTSLTVSPGRPLVSQAGGVYFDWVGKQTSWPTGNLYLKEYSGSPSWYYHIPHDPVALCGTKNRSSVRAITDYVGRKTTFEYEWYKRIANTIYPDLVCDDWYREDQTRIVMAKELYMGQIPRIKKIVYPDGAESIYTYRYNGFNDDLSVDFSPICGSDTNQIAKYPCRKSDEFEEIGRDPFFNNMVTARRRYIRDATDSTLMFIDSLDFAWTDLGTVDYIDGADTFFTTRYTGRHEDSLTGATASDATKKRTLKYQYFSESGTYSPRSRDRSWVMRLMSERTESSGDPVMPTTTTTNTWDPSKLIKTSSTIEKDGAEFTYSYQTDFHGNDYLDTANSLNWTYEDDPWGIRTATFYDSTWLDFDIDTVIDTTSDTTIQVLVIDTSWDTLIDSTWFPYPGVWNVDTILAIDSLDTLEFIVDTNYYYDSTLDIGFYNNVLANSVITTIQPAGTRLAHSATQYYDGLDSLGYAGQLKTSKTYLVENGSIVDSLQEHYEYLKDYTEADYNEGMLRKEINSEGDSTVYHYHEMIPYPYIPGWENSKPNQDPVACPVIGYEAKQDGTIDTLNSERWTFNNPTAWYKKIEYVASSGTVDSLVYNQIVNSDGLTTHLVGANRYLSRIGYDEINRFKTAILPGGFVNYDYWYPSPRYNYERPTLDATWKWDLAMYGGGRLYQCESDTAILYCSDVSSARDSLWGPIFYFDDLRTDNMYTVDSAFLHVYVKNMNVAVNFKYDVRTTNWDPESFIDCNTGSMIPPKIISAQSDLAVGKNKVDVTAVVGYWANYGKDHGICITTDTVSGLQEASSTAIFYTTEAADDSLRPWLEVYWKTDDADADSTYSFRYVYDDNISDGDGAKVTTLTRKDSTSWNYTNRVLFDSLGRAFQRQALDSAIHVDSSSYDSTVSKFDFAGRTIEQRDQLGNGTKSTYDILDRSIETMFPGIDSSTFETDFGSCYYGIIGLDTMGLSFMYDTLFWVEVIDENGNERRVYNDVRGKVRLQRNQVGASTYLDTYFDYDDLGNLTLIIKPNGDSVQYEYNSLGQLTKEWAADYDAIFYEYDKLGQLVKYRDGTHDDGDPYYRYTDYDELGRVKATGRLDPVPNSGDIKTVYQRLFYDQYNVSNSRARMSASWTNDKGYDYGQMYNYDARGRISSHTNYFNATLDSVVDSTLDSTLYQYYLAGDSFEVAYEYNWADQPTKLTYPDSLVVTYDYDDRGRLESVGTTTDPDRYARFVYTARDEIDSIILGNVDTLYGKYRFNERGWTTSINYDDTNPSTPPIFTENLNYKFLHPDLSDTTYGLNGNIIKQSLYQGAATTQYLYQYDNMDRLEDVDTLALGNAYNLETFTYDDNGNRLTYIQNGTTTTSYLYTSGTNQLASTSGASVSAYTYDANGNLLTDNAKGATFHYDLFNQLDSIEVDHSRGHNYVTFGYNTAGERVWKEHEYWYSWQCGGGGEEPLGSLGGEGSLLLGGGIETLGGPGGTTTCWDTQKRGTYYVRSGGKVLAEYTSLTSAPKFKFIYAGDQRIAMIDDQGDVHFYLNDHLGSARRVIAENGLMQESYTYWAFGESRAESIAKNQAYRYTGKPFDDNEGINLYYYGARYYDADGRFTAIDPLARMYPGWSPYVYTLNNPLKYIDQNGLWSTKVHNKILKAAFGDMPRELRIFQRASAESDAFENQGPGTAHRHAMREPGETVSQAGSKFDLFVGNKAADFITNGSVDAGLYSLGEAFHAMMDATSPSHAGFQEWDSRSWGVLLKTVWHLYRERDSKATDALIEQVATILRGFYDDAVENQSVYQKEEKRKREQQKLWKGGSRSGKYSTSDDNRNGNVNNGF